MGIPGETDKDWLVFPADGSQLDNPCTKEGAAPKPKPTAPSCLINPLRLGLQQVHPGKWGFSSFAFAVLFDALLEISLL
jgi:hypothetical protein